MSFFVRKISLAKWLQNNIADGAFPSGDAITGCLRTQMNTLSLWEVPNESEIDDGILAIISTQEKIEKNEFTVISSEDLSTASIQFLQESDLANPIADLEKKHFNIKNVDLSSLSKVSVIIIEKIKSKKIVVKSRLDLMKILKAGVSAGRVDFQKIKPKLKTEIETNSFYSS